jgi:hypothetical protein
MRCDAHRPFPLLSICVPRAGARPAVPRASRPHAAASSLPRTPGAEPRPARLVSITDLWARSLAAAAAARARAPSFARLFLLLLPVLPRQPRVYHSPSCWCVWWRSSRALVSALLRVCDNRRLPACRPGLSLPARRPEPRCCSQSGWRQRRRDAWPRHPHALRGFHMATPCAAARRARVPPTRSRRRGPSPSTTAQRAAGCLLGSHRYVFLRRWATQHLALFALTAHKGGRLPLRLCPEGPPLWLGPQGLPLRLGPEGSLSGLALRGSLSGAALRAPLSSLKASSGEAGGGLQRSSPRHAPTGPKHSVPARCHMYQPRPAPARPACDAAGAAPGPPWPRRGAPSGRHRRPALALRLPRRRHRADPRQ